MVDRVFFYGTLMRGFPRRRRAGLERKLRFLGYGAIEAALFDLGLYPAAVPCSGSSVRGELYEVVLPAVLMTLDAIEGCAFADPAAGLYVRQRVEVVLDTGGRTDAWVYFYHQNLQPAVRIPSGDYRRHLQRR